MFVSLQSKRWAVIVVSYLLLGQSFLVLGQGSNGAGELDALPKVPASVAREVSPYTRMSSYGLVGWHPSRRELWAKAITSSYTGVASVDSPGDSPQLQVFYRLIFMRSITRPKVNPQFM